METKAFRLTILLLAFSIGIAAASLFYFRPAKMASIRSVEVEESGSTTDTGSSLEMVFVIDTTGSMGGLIDGAKQKVWSIVNEVQQRSSHPAVKVGLVAYRDRGDAYITQVTPLTDDLDKVYSNLMDLQAAGGGDEPEDVRAALADGFAKSGWSEPRRGLAQIIFLVGDAPPHDYANEPDVVDTATNAVNKQIIVNTIQCGVQNNTKEIWQKIAQYGQGKYFAIPQDGGVAAIETPYDAKLGELGRSIGGTYTAYGENGVRTVNMAIAGRMESKMSANASNTAVADRALNKAVNKDAYQGDLIQDVENGKVKLADVKDSDLPNDLQKLSREDREKEVAKRIADRKAIRAQIMELSKQREAYIAAQKARSGKKGGFDEAVSVALNDQLSRRGIK